MLVDRKRRRMTELQLASRGITRQNVLDAFAQVPREAFVSIELEDRAYDDSALPIGADQTISQPYVVARTIEALELEGLPGDVPGRGRELVPAGRSSAIRRCSLASAPITGPYWPPASGARRARS